MSATINIIIIIRYTYILLRYKWLTTKIKQI